MSEHTPTPWEDGTRHNGDPEWIFASGAAIADCGFFSDDAINRSNVAFIVLAVNNHNRLTHENEATRKALLEISGPPFVGIVRMRQIVETALASLKVPPNA